MTRYASQLLAPAEGFSFRPRANKSLIMLFWIIFGVQYYPKGKFLAWAPENLQNKTIVEEV